MTLNSSISLFSFWLPVPPHVPSPQSSAVTPYFIQGSEWIFSVWTLHQLCFWVSNLGFTAFLIYSLQRMFNSFQFWIVLCQLISTPNLAYLFKVTSDLKVSNASSSSFSCIDDKIISKGSQVISVRVVLYFAVLRLACCSSIFFVLRLFLLNYCLKTPGHYIR